MKKFLIAILALLTIFCLVACNNNTSLIACPKCGYENSNGAKFCSGCGKPLPGLKSHCPKCGKELDSGAKFCSGCGHQMF
jgi:predicted amidophosphoribosyltransferase